MASFFAIQVLRPLKAQLKRLEYFADKGMRVVMKSSVLRGLFMVNMAALAAPLMRVILTVSTRLAGFKHVDSFDIELVKAAITPATAAILVEPIQGEGGLSLYLSLFQTLRELCDSLGLTPYF